MLVGAVTYVSGTGVKVGGKIVNAGGNSNPKATVMLRKLYAGDAVRATEHGWVQFTIRIGGRVAYCRTDPDDGLVVVRPKATVFMDFRSGTTFCATPASGGEKLMNAGAQAKIETSDPVFEVVAGKRKTLFKVRQGFAVVSANGGVESAVVVDRDHQTIVPTGDKPASPTKTKQLTASEKAKLDKLKNALPPVTDTAAPTPVVTGPRDLSSLRTATFSFTVKEPAITFSCALDGTDFRLCTSPQAFDHLHPGRHTFTVKATDQAGNTGTTAYGWTIDSSRVVFASKRGGDGQIYVMDPEADSPATQLTDKGPNWDPVWSPDRKRIAFHSDRDGNSEIYVMNADGSDQRRLTNNKWIDRNPTWNRDGSQIAFERNAGNSDIYVMNADGTGERQVTGDPADDIDPAWSRSGEIAFASRRDSSAFQIYVMNVQGVVRRLTNAKGQEFNPAWSPDGTKLAFHSDRDGVSAKIYVMNPDGSNQRPVTTTSSADFNPAWAPDGQELAFQRLLLNGRSQLFVVNVDGTNTFRLTDGSGDDLVPDW